MYKIIATSRIDFPKESPQGGLSSLLRGVYGGLEYLEGGLRDLLMGKEEKKQEPVDLEPETAAALKSKGNEEYIKGNYREALRYYLQALELDREYPEVYFNLGQTFIKLNRNKQAIFNYRKAIEFRPDYWKAHHAFLNTLFLEGDYPDGRAAAEKAKALIEQKRVLNEEWPAKVWALGKKVCQVNRLNSSAMIAMTKEHWEVAIALFTQVIEKNPRDARSFLNRSSSYMRLKKFEEALADLQQALTLNPHYDLARKAFIGELGMFFFHPKIDSAKRGELIRQAFQIDPDPKTGELYLYRSHFYQEQGEYDKALKDIARCEELDMPIHLQGVIEELELKVMYHSKRADKYREQENYPAAIADWTEVLRLNKKEADAPKILFERGRAYFCHQQYEAARADFLSGISGQHEHYQLEKQIIVATLAKQLEEGSLRADAGSMKFIDELEKTLHDMPFFYCVRASFYLENGHFQLALRDIDRLGAMKSEHSSSAPCLRAEVYQKMGKPEEAEAVLIKAVTTGHYAADGPYIRYTKAQDLVALAKLLIAKNDLVAALSYIDLAIKSSHDYMPTYVVKGQILSNQGKHSEAILFFNEAETLWEKADAMQQQCYFRAKASSLYNNRGCCHFEEKAYEKALADYQKALSFETEPFNKSEIEKNIADVQDILRRKEASPFWKEGSHLFSVGEFEKALALFTQAIDIYKRLIQEKPHIDLYKQNLSFLYCNRFQVYWHLQNIDKAIPDILEAERLNSNDREILSCRAWVEEAGKNFQLAIQYLTRALQHEASNHNEFNIYHNRMILFARIGLFGRAIEDANKLIELEPEDPTGYYYKAGLLIELEDKSAFIVFVNSYPQWFRNEETAKESETALQLEYKPSVSEAKEEEKVSAEKPAPVIETTVLTSLKKKKKRKKRKKKVSQPSIAAASSSISMSSMQPEAHAQKVIKPQSKEKVETQKISLIGRVYWARTIGYDPKYERPVVVLGEKKDSLIVAPMTTQKLQKIKWSEVPLHLKRDCKVQLQRARTISARSLLRPFTTIDPMIIAPILQTYSQVKQRETSYN